MSTEPESTIRDIARRWVKAFGLALEDASVGPAPLTDLFVEDSHWRDLVAFTWDNRQVSGRDRLIARLLTATPWAAPRNFRLASGYSAPKEAVATGRDVIEAFFEFDTEYGTGLGFIRLLADKSQVGARGWMMLTQIESVVDAARVRRSERPSGVGYDKQGGKLTWTTLREHAQEFADREPEVLIVGGGQAGVMLAAHLNRLGVDNLVIDAHQRVGDNWRTRYDSLQLHNQTEVVQFPYLPFPDVFPEYISKDKLANWFEAYVDVLEINFWTATPFTTASYDEQAERWTVPLDRDGAARTLRPRHIVMTTGGTGVVASIPNLPGLEAFNGEVLHSKEFRTGADYDGKRALVVGVGTSAHDLAYNLVLHGAESVTMLQRGSVTVTSLESANSVFGIYSRGLPIVEADTITALGWIEPIQRLNLQESTRVNDARDADLLNGLRAKGLHLDDGVDHTGWIRKFISRGGGYYINVGTSELILEGRIGIIQSDDVARFAEHQLLLNDGNAIDLDVVIMATGFKNQEALVRQQFGDEVADRVGPIGGYDDEAEVRNNWRHSGQPGLWFGSGSIQNCRTFTPLVAMQIAAELRGLGPVPAEQDLLAARSTAEPAIN